MLRGDPGEYYRNWNFVNFWGTPNPPDWASGRHDEIFTQFHKLVLRPGPGGYAEQQI